MDETQQKEDYVRSILYRGILSVFRAAWRRAEPTSTCRQYGYHFRFRWEAADTRPRDYTWVKYIRLTYCGFRCRHNSRHVTLPSCSAHVDPMSASHRSLRRSSSALNNNSIIIRRVELTSPLSNKASLAVGQGGCYRSVGVQTKPHDKSPCAENLSTTKAVCNKTPATATSPTPCD